jgi:AraC family transcriptional regulator
MIGHIHEQQIHGNEALQRRTDAALAPDTAMPVPARFFGGGSGGGSGGVRVGVRQRQAPGRTELPAIAAHRIAVAYCGDPRVVWSDGARTVVARLRRDSITVVPAGVAGRLDWSGPSEIACVHLPEARLQYCAALIGLPVHPALLLRVGVPDPRATAILGMLVENAQNAANGDAPARLFAEQCVELLCIQLLRAHSSAHCIVAGPQRGLADWQVHRVTDYMQARLDQQIGLDELAAQVRLSRFHFCTAFRLATGQTPHDWLTTRRMDRAATLLGDRRLSITEIALQVGYQTPSSFAARFRREMGMTPSAYRRRSTLP